MTAAKRDLKFMTNELLNNMRNESICIHENPPAVHTVGCLTEVKSNISDCELVSIFGSYITEATDLGIHSLVTEQFQAINQYLQSIQNVLCKTEPVVNSCTVAFQESDGDYEKVCKMMNLLMLLTRWLSREDC
ncbi:hypothetical protein Baya_13595 [Bagarius yarrelli]|uniref:Uncharacterized protein n=1 Tax=Bagarius yarrelli TaxID=175774 RepID=A0A556V6L7_BAGYA|nr:hypothetical protein Baya_13595 [Bagarius yarrelli]